MLFATVFTSLLAAGLALAQDYTVNTPVRVLLTFSNIADLVLLISHLLPISSNQTSTFLL